MDVLTYFPCEAWTCGVDARPGLNSQQRQAAPLRLQNVGAVGRGCSVNPAICLIGIVRNELDCDG